MKIIVCENAHEVALKAYEVFKNQLTQKPSSILGLATGSSPILLYKELIQGYLRNEISFKEVITFNLDEYVGMDDSYPQSYAYFMKHHLFDHVDINELNTYIPNGRAENLVQECAQYHQALSESGVDLQLLGIGSNGHIGFNEPPTSFESSVHVVKLKESTRNDNAMFFQSIEEVPTHAISMGIQDILKSKKIVLLACGKKKAEAIKAMVLGAIDESCPGSILQTHNDVTLILDEEAASLLKQK
jgi:glucosamine-6-phosphate deaminase